MKQIPGKKIDTAGLRRALTALAVAAGLAGWAALARPEGDTASLTPAAQVAVAQAPARRLRAVTAAPAPITSTRSSR